MSTLYDALRQLQNDRVEEARNWLSTGGYAGRDDEARELATECWHRYVAQALEVEYREWPLENDRVENLQ